MRFAVIIAAAGTSRRFNLGAEPDAIAGARSKLDEDLGGRPVLQRAVELFTSRDDVAAVIVAGPHDDQAMADFRLRHADRLELLGASLCRGGAQFRWQSVRAALDHVPSDATHIAIHDAARPVATQALIDRVFAAADAYPAVVPVIDVADTIKKLGDDLHPQHNHQHNPQHSHDPLSTILGANHATPPRAVIGTVDRTHLALVQTPQVFAADLLRRAYDQPDLSSTDDAGLVERLGQTVAAIPGDPLNIKITVPADIELARVIGGFPMAAQRPTHKRF